MQRELRRSDCCTLPGAPAVLTTNLLYLAAFLAVAIGLIHSLLGEKYILQRLFRRAEIPQLFGSAEFTTRTLRFAWHLTTVAWFGFAAILVLMAHPPVTIGALGTVVGVTFMIHFLVALLGTRGRHLSWILFLVIGICAFYAV